MPIVASTIIETKFGKLRVCYHKSNCVSFSMGDLSKGHPIVRIHSACLFNEVFGSLHCDCAQQLEATLIKIQQNKCGAIIYSYKEGRGIGLKNKIKAMEIQRKHNCNTIEAFKILGYRKSDYRNFKAEAKALKDLGLKNEIKFLSGNPKKLLALKNEGFLVKELVKININKLSKFAKEERDVKKVLGYIY